MELNDSKSTYSTQKDQNRPRLTFTFPKFNEKKCKSKNLLNSYIISHIIILKKKLDLNDSKSTNWTQNSQNRPKITFIFLKFNQEQMQN